ncbi:MAG: hypothetical protein L6R39_005174 [Caloplaca ligustica]|nr:MAG: hypothetical protein L6R39_005174 [Caloplaca ligustica]
MRRALELRLRDSTITEVDKAKVADYFERRKTLLAAAGETALRREDQLVGDMFPDAGIYHDASAHCSAQWYSLIYCDVRNAAIFITEEHASRFVELMVPLEFNANEMYQLFENGKIDAVADGSRA